VHTDNSAAISNMHYYVWKTEGETLCKLKKLKTLEDKKCGVCLFVFHLYPPVTRKRRWRYILDESAPAY